MNSGLFLKKRYGTDLFVDSKTYKSRRELLAERELTSKKAFETAQSLELATKEDIRDVITTGVEPVNKVAKVATSRRPQGESGSCFRCGQKHARSECWCKTAQCYRCKKRVILPRCVIRNVMLATRVMLRMFRS